MQNTPGPEPRRHVWPWYALGLLILGCLLAVLWVSAEARRMRERRQYYLPAGDNAVVMPSTNAPAKPSH